MNQLTHHDRETLNRIVNDWKLTPATFGYKLSQGAWIPSPHLLYVSKKVASGIAKGNARIIISAPPRHGKSQLIDIYTSAWILEHFQNKHVILCSYGADLSEGFGRQVRDLIVRNEDLLSARIRTDAGRVDAFRLTGGGGMSSVGLGGSITGRGADVLLIDDYIKEIKEALSPVSREYVWNWFVTTAYTRLEPNASCIIIATRWHSDDLIGRIINNFPGQWEHIVLQAEIETPEDARQDPLHREIGEALFPERYPIEKLHEIKDVLGSSFYQALYQQKPIDEGKKLSDGAWLKKTQICPPLETLKLMRMWDLAATEGGGDYTTGALCGYDRSNGYFYIINIVRDQLSPEKAQTLVRKTAISDGTDVAIGIEQEGGSAGKTLVEFFERVVLPEYTVEGIPVSGEGKKVIRAQPLLAGAEAGKVILLEAGWNDQYVREFDQFPVGPYDDQVDTTAAAYTKLTGKKVFSATWGRPNNNYNSTNTRKKAGNKGIKQASFSLQPRRGISWGRR